jgi:hypothetical protein
MSGGLLDDITQVGHLIAGMGISFDEALDIVNAARDVAALDEPTPPTRPTLTLIQGGKS